MLPRSSQGLLTSTSRIAVVVLTTVVAGCVDDPLRPDHALAPIARPAFTQSPGASPFLELGAIRQVTFHPSAQFDPSISGDIVVYTDLRNGPSDIYFTDLAANTEGAVTTAFGAQQLHDVSGNTIVFTNSGSAPVQVWTYDVVTAVSALLAPSPFPEREPTISGNRVAFEIYPDGPGTNADVAVSVLSSGTYTRIANTSLHEGRPVIGGDYVVFERGSVPLDPNGDIVLYHIPTGVETVLGTGLEPHTDGRRVAWWGGGFSMADINVVDIATGTTWTIAFQGAQTRPRLSGDLISFDDNSTGNPDIVVMHLWSGKQLRIGSAAAEFLADLDGNRVAYTSNQTGNFDIYVADLITDFPDIDAAPGAVAFGDVAVGATVTQIVTVTNTGDADLEVQSANLTAGSAAAFAIASTSSALPATLSPGSVLDVEVRFTPSAQAAFAGVLRIASNDFDEAIVDVALSGNGTGQQSVAQQVVDLLAFFDASVGSGALTGDGAGQSAAKRLQALRNMLVAAGGMIGDGALADACTQLQDVHVRADGLPQPPDFVTGPAAAELRERIAAISQGLGCASG